MRERQWTSPVKPSPVYKIKRLAPLAQWIEHLPSKQRVRGSNPWRGTKLGPSGSITRMQGLMDLAGPCDGYRVIVTGVSNTLLIAFQ